MNNTETEQILDNCTAELERVRRLIEDLGITSPIAPYLTNYVLIRACGTVEQVFKSIIADYCGKRSKKTNKTFPGKEGPRIFNESLIQQYLPASSGF